MSSLFSLVPSASKLGVAVFAVFKAKEVIYCGAQTLPQTPADSINKIGMAGGRRRQHSKKAFVDEQPEGASPSQHSFV
jgi:hypothetical protein